MAFVTRHSRHGVTGLVTRESSAYFILHYTTLASPPSCLVDSELIQGSRFQVPVCTRVATVIRVLKE